MNTTASFLGLDLGTSGLRALLVSETGAVVGEASETYDTAQPFPGASEQDPADWIDALNKAVHALSRNHPSEWRVLAGIGVSGHMHGATLLDAADNVIRPCILWNDTRSKIEADELDATADVREISGNIVFPGFTAPKLRWVERHEPQHFKNVAKVLLPAAYMNLHLTGRHFADMSDSAGTAWLDCGGRQWSGKLLDEGHMRRDQMPDLIEGCEVGGTLRSDLASQWGVSDKTVVVGGAGDNAAAACGTGRLDEGDAFVSLGTSGVMLAARNGYRPLPASAVHTFCHALPGRWYQMGVILAATDCMNWLSRLTGKSPETLSEDLGNEVAPPGPVRFYPYLSGERTPHNDADIRGAFSGLSISTGAGDLTRAVMTGVAFALRDSQSALAQTGARPQTLLGIGGGMASPYWTELLATVLDTPIERPAKGEFGAALGAARLAMIGATKSDPASIIQKPEIGETVEPRKDLIAAYDDAYKAFRAGYSKLEDLQSG